jgi:hypothetical protein
MGRAKGLFVACVSCIGRGNARSPYEFGCKVSIATPVTAAKGGSSCCKQSLRRQPYDGRTFGQSPISKGAQVLPQRNLAPQFVRMVLALVSLRSRPHPHGNSPTNGKYPLCHGVHRRHL